MESCIKQQRTCETIMKNMKKILFILSISFAVAQLSTAQQFAVSSPDKRINLKVDIAGQISWKVTLDEQVIIEQGIAGMDFSTGADFGISNALVKHAIKGHNETIIAGVPHKNREIQDDYNELTLQFKDNYHLRFRAYNDGIAYQFTDMGNLKREVMDETVSFVFPKDTYSLFPQEESMYSHNERLYLKKELTAISDKDFCSLPVMFATPYAKVLFTETALHDYPGMFLKGSAGQAMHAIFPHYVLEAKDNPSSGDRNQIITKEADYIASVDGNRDFPWRVFVISKDDRDFVKSNLTYQLSKPQAIANTSWIKPGQVAWDWYNANNIYGVDFKSGINTATYKYFIDFAASKGIRYVILDEGWTKSTTDILHVNPDMDVQELIQYGQSKNVDIILWVLWKPLDANLDEILYTYKSWGAKGIKVDFMQRNDQYMVSSYERIAKACADRELLVDFHGAFKPSGLRRMYPNVINYEGVKGSENNKWSKDITPSHNVTLPFIRMAAGPLDYTPGVMVNKHAINFAVSFERPMSMGTRAHQVAMYIVYEAPLQMLCESPSRYKQEEETVNFITSIPTVWDETKVLHGKVGEYIVVARRKGNNWYIGAMTNEQERALPLDFSFLGKGNFAAKIFMDGVNADRYAEDYRTENMQVNQSTKYTIKMAGGGGWSMVLVGE